MTHDSQWKHEAGWRDMEFAADAKLPEGRKPLTWADLGVGPHSQALDDRDAWRAKAEELALENERLVKAGIIEVAVRNPNVMEYMRHWEDRAEKAEARVAELEAALQQISLGNSLSPTTLEGARYIARAALKQEGET